MNRILMAWAFLIVCTSFESFGDATVRIGFYSGEVIAEAFGLSPGVAGVLRLDGLIAKVLGAGKKT